ncbi:hypothetical protein OSH11_07205 [Kaistia dalseonensis]|uniref:Uncharacterized protein n=1 Tax=Kaistia dalseonensis TaxID=410840 RepID=A0ABU0H432_9HYPH|nr:hypothetical protein [Kaistia dalseonensis]MCX5494482.1 hypothetical protein [Kaistia dalseonensis]MDQ0437061.1 hypothetical protein [Kaistia dalseonensis]
MSDDNFADVRLPADFTPEALARMREIAKIVRSNVANTKRTLDEFAEPAPVLDLHLRRR